MLGFVKPKAIYRIFCAVIFIMTLCNVANGETNIHHPIKHAPASKKKAAKTEVLPTHVSLQQGLDQIISQFNPNLNIGVVVQSTDNGALRYAHNASLPLTPGSSLKLFTAVSALAYLGPNYTFPTQILAPRTPLQGIVNGNLYVRFSGDPTLRIQDLAMMVRNLRDQGVRVIQGNLIIDDSAMDHVNSAPGWNPQDALAWFSAPASAIVLNRNFFGFQVKGSQQNGVPAQVSYGSNLGVISVVNQVMTRRARYVDCPLNVKPTGSNTYLISGCLAPRRYLDVGVAINDPRRVGTSVVLGLLQQYGITVNGGLGYGRTPANLLVLAEHDSQPLGLLINHMLKKSDNLFANTFFKKLGNVYFNTEGSWNSGLQAVRAILGPRTGINFNDITMLDGSGLSHENKVSPLQFATLLNYAYHDLPNRDVFYSALPRSGIDGTLRFRLGQETLDKIHAKTGTLQGASSLAGYVHTASNQTLTFAIIVNGLGNQGTYHRLEDKICKFLAMQ